MTGPGDKTCREEGQGKDAGTVERVLTLASWCLAETAVRTAGRAGDAIDGTYDAINGADYAIARVDDTIDGAGGSIDGRRYTQECCYGSGTGNGHSVSRVIASRAAL